MKVVECDCLRDITFYAESIIELSFVLSIREYSKYLLPTFPRKGLDLMVA